MRCRRNGSAFSSSVSTGNKSRNRVKRATNGKKPFDCETGATRGGMPNSSISSMKRVILRYRSSCSALCSRDPAEGLRLKRPGAFSENLNPSENSSEGA